MIVLGRNTSLYINIPGLKVNNTWKVLIIISPVTLDGSLVLKISIFLILLKTWKFIYMIVLGLTLKEKNESDKYVSCFAM
jgi:hypothetical protein